MEKDKGGDIAPCWLLGGREIRAGLFQLSWSMEKRKERRDPRSRGVERTVVGTVVGTVGEGTV